MEIFISLSGIGVAGRVATSTINPPKTVTINPPPTKIVHGWLRISPRRVHRFWKKPCDDIVPLWVQLARAYISLYQRSPQGRLTLAGPSRAEHRPRPSHGHEPGKKKGVTPERITPLQAGRGQKATRRSPSQSRCQRSAALLASLPHSPLYSARRPRSPPWSNAGPH